MSDICERLENCSYENAPSRCFEAAREIRRLREQLVKCRETLRAAREQGEDRQAFTYQLLLEIDRALTDDQRAIGLDWKLSNETKEQLAEIDKHTIAAPWKP